MSTPRATLDTKSAWRERGFADGYNKRPREAPEAPPELRDQYLSGYRLGKLERERGR